MTERKYPDWYTEERIAEIVAEKASRRVYFARASEGVGPVKIGCSLKPDARIRGLNNWSPFRLTVLASMSGDYQLESRFHTLFAADWSHNEWFRWTPEMQSVIDAVAASTFDIGTLPTAAKRSYGGRHNRKLVAA